MKFFQFQIFNRLGLSVCLLFLTLVIIGKYSSALASVQRYQPIGDVIDTTKNKNVSLEKWLVGATNDKGEWIQNGVMLTTIDGLLCVTTGCPISKNNTSNTNRTLNQNGALGGIGNMIVLLYAYPPTSSPRYIADIFSNTLLPKPTFAQSLLVKGTIGFDPIFSIWKEIRNLAYVMFIVIFVTIGFMIMFRHKLDPQTVVTVQNSIPHIVVGLILVSLSYAISGFMIDISNISVFLFSSTLNGFHSSNISFDAWLKTLMGQDINVINIFTLMFNIGGAAAGQLKTSIQGIIDTLTAGMNLGPLLTPILSSFAALVLSFAIIGAMFKTFFALISAYITIVFLTIFSPVVFLTSSLPGKNSAIEQWVRNMLASVLVFPALFIFLYIGAIISTASTALNTSPWYIGSTSSFTNPWVPFGLSGYGTAVGDLIKYLIGFGVVITSPSIPTMIQGFVQAKESPLAGTAQALQGTLQRIPVVGSFLG